MSGIVVGVDGSETARAAAAKAAEMATRLGEPLHLVMAMKPGRSQSMTVGADVFYDDWIGNGRQQRLQMVDDLGFPGATVAIGGKDPARSLCEEAQRIDATMIVVGNRRVQGASRVLGSIAGDVTRRAHCDVLVANTAEPRAERAHFGISSASVFEPCTPKQRRAIDELATPIAVTAGQELTREGRTGREFGVLLDGTATVSIDGEHVATLSAGDHFGELALLDEGTADGAERMATVTADSDLWIAIMSAGEFRSLLTDHPDVAARLRTTAAERTAGV